LIRGDSIFDKRGNVSFFNNFRTDAFVRQYVVRNYSQHFIRAWHGHKKETKAVHVLQGVVQCSCVKVDNWEKPSEELEIQSFILSASKPEILIIPEGFANGFMNLTNDAIVQFFSNKSLEESLQDDFRFPFDYWNPWKTSFY
jgi:dTDP-4-dehydrorhamnose 3,5-epimerase-like enzyme